MAWRGPREKGEFPTLGFAVAEWIEAFCVIPDGMRQGEPYRLTNEMLLFLIWFYRLWPSAVVNENKPSAPFRYRGGQLIRPQKWGKSPFAASILLAETFGPVRFDGWDAAGEPVGCRNPTPWCQTVATSEEQTDNTWLALLEMAKRGPIANEPGVDIGVEDINLPDGGKLEPQTSSGRSRLGARLRFGHFDESGLMVETNGGVLLVTMMKRNVAGIGGRWLETTNMFDPSEQSVAQRTYESAATDVFIDYRPPSKTPDLADRATCLAELKTVYGDSYWVDLDRVYADAKDVAVCPTPADAYRFFFNLPHVGVADVVDPTRWASQTRERDLKPKEMIALGFDGSRANDCTALVACRITDGRLFHLRTWDPAEHPRHAVPRLEVDRVVTDAFKAYDVRYLYADPARWETELDTWAGRWPKRIVEFSTNAPQRMDAALSRFRTEAAGQMTHDGNQMLAQHLRNAAVAKGARKQPRPEEDPSLVQHYLTITKRKQSGHIDAAVAAILAVEARGYAIENGALKKKAKAWAMYE